MSGPNDLDFSHLEALDVKDRTAWWPMPGVPGAALQVKPATEANKRYHNVVVRRTRGHQARVIASQGVSTAMREQWRAEDRDLYPKMIVVGWRGMTNKAKVEVPFGMEASVKLCASMPDWMFDQLRDFCSNDPNFIDPAAADAAADPEGVAKN